MSLDLLRRLANKWFPREGAPFQAALDAVFDHIGFTDDPGFVASAIEAYRSGFGTRNSKVIKDSVWGMVEFDPQSIRLLESPIVQRLRGIKQLGFSYLTYPSAEHSRFIHSLGMYCVVARFIEAIDKQAAEPQGREQPPYQIIPVDEPLKRDLLHAAILHDIGHAPFSHASEKIFEADVEKFRIGNYELKEFLFDVQEILEKSLPLSECISLALILSPRFRKFYEEYVRPGEGDPDAVYRIAALIAGIRPRPNLRGAADLISEDVVDADKVDYVNRDALACGIPVGVDVARLFLRSVPIRLRQTPTR